jgi:hypothetical protein
VPHARWLAAYGLIDGGGPFPFPIKSKGTERCSDTELCRQRARNSRAQAWTSTEFAVRSRIVHREVRPDLMNPPKWLSVIPLAEPELSLASLQIQREAVEKGLRML